MKVNSDDENEKLTVMMKIMIIMMMAFYSSVFWLHEKIIFRWQVETIMFRLAKKIMFRMKKNNVQLV